MDKMSFYQRVNNFIFRKVTENNKFHLPNYEDLGNLKIRYIDIGAAGGLNENMLFLAPILDITGFEPDHRSLTFRKFLSHKELEATRYFHLL